ncbi:hypothetical protein DVH24_000520 [Malus domestica]|uniref:Uncharacterized protein n=1 Tax=Malus domestica TaxID=3750 RepID=A0A498J638_MALDO|nr:hypothetical protein DVH24_000520 [Malus domestica]
MPDNMISLNESHLSQRHVLENCLKPLLPSLISPMQNAFVAGRQIYDNVGIAHETKQKFKLGIKLDMQKAYDRVEWNFLEAVMERTWFDGN